MRAQRGLIAGIVAILASASGCMTCGADGYGLARQAGPECEVSTCQRNQVHVFVVGDMNPLHVTHLDALRGQLNKQGFAKVTTGQSVYSWWMPGEMRRIRKEEPNAVFVVIGTEGAGHAASRLAEKAQRSGLPVGGVVLFDRDTKPRTPENLRSITVASETSAPESVALVTQFLNEVAMATTLTASVQKTEWDYPDAPEQRPFIEPGRHHEWTFLFDDGVTPPGVNPSPVPAIAAQTPQPNTTAARR